MRKTRSQVRRERQQAILACVMLAASLAMIGFLFSPWYMPVAGALWMPVHPIHQTRQAAPAQCIRTGREAACE